MALLDQRLFWRFRFQWRVVRVNHYGGSSSQLWVIHFIFFGQNDRLISRRVVDNCLRSYLVFFEFVDLFADHSEEADLDTLKELVVVLVIASFLIGYFEHIAGKN